MGQDFIVSRDYDMPPVKSHKEVAAELDRAVEVFIANGGQVQRPPIKTAEEIKKDIRTRWVNTNYNKV